MTDRTDVYQFTVTVESTSREQAVKVQSAFFGAWLRDLQGTGLKIEIGNLVGPK